jgi:hypothetical protein
VVGARRVGLNGVDGKRHQTYGPGPLRHGPARLDHHAGPPGRGHGTTV